MDDWKDKLAKSSGYSRPPIERSQKSENKKEQKISFYKEDNTLVQELLDTKAREWAISFINPKTNDARFQAQKLSSAQLRRFHNDIRELEAKIQSADEKEFKRFLPLVKMVKSKVAYACPPNVRDRKVPEEFRNYMELMINSIENKKDFEAFSLCFEAVVGYFYGEGGR